MDRITIRGEHGVFLSGGWDFEINPDEYDLVQKVLDRLAAYEDTGMEPEQIHELQIHPDHAYAAYVKQLFPIMERLEELARAVEQGIFTLDMLLCGVPSLPAAQEQPLELCFVALGFDRRPESVEQVKEFYHKRAMMRHPDKGGSDEAFAALTRYYKECLAKMEEAT